VKKFDIYWNNNYIATGEYKNALQAKRAFSKLLGVSIQYLRVEAHENDITRDS
jgi:hypothetical protein